MPTALDHSRIGLIVGKKTARLAVQRNYMKRVLRELFRLHQPLLGGVDILLRVHQPFASRDHATVRSEFLELLDNLRRRVGKTGKP